MNGFHSFVMFLLLIAAIGLCVRINVSFSGFPKFTCFSYSVLMTGKALGHWPWIQKNLNIYQHIHFYLLCTVYLFIVWRSSICLCFRQKWRHLPTWSTLSIWVRRPQTFQSLWGLTLFGRAWRWNSPAPSTAIHPQRLRGKNFCLSDTPFFWPQLTYCDFF